MQYTARFHDTACDVATVHHMYIAEIFLENKSRSGKLRSSNIEGVRTLSQAVDYVSASV